MLKHGSESTISAGCRGTYLRWIAQRSPPAGCRNQMDLSVERPLSPLLAHAVAHDHSRHVAVGAPVHLISPTFDHRNAYDLHVEQFRLVAHARHASDESLASAPCALSVFGEHLPHL